MLLCGIENKTTSKMDIYPTKFGHLLTLLFISHLFHPIFSFASILQPYDRTILLQIQEHFGGPKSQFWNSSSSDCCLFCDAPVRCDSDGHVSGLFLVSNPNLSGEIPLAVADLTFLKHLSIIGPGFTGPILSAVGKLTNLEELIIKKTSITGRIPGSLGRLKNLATLYLSNNKLSGHIPYSLGQLTNLLWLDLSSNNLSGPIRESLGQLQGLSWLSLGNNKLAGPIPDSLGQVTNLEELSLSFNRLSGPIPEFLGQLTKLRQLNLSSNKLSSPMPNSLTNLYNLNSLILNSNKVYGQIPTSICSLTYATFISLHSNQLSGQIPDCSWYNFDQFSLLLSNNQLTGQVPKSLAVASFHTLDLSRNKLTDASYLFNKQTQGGWIYIDLSNNLLEFDLSEAVFPPEQRVLNISHNMIYGSLPEQLAQISSETSVDVSYNELCGPIPKSTVLEQLSTVNFEHNKCLCGAPLPPCNASLPPSSAPSPSPSIIIRGMA